jgi:hypothetical protein
MVKSMKRSSRKLYSPKKTRKNTQNGGKYDENGNWNYEDNKKKGDHKFKAFLSSRYYDTSDKAFEDDLRVSTLDEKTFLELIDTTYNKDIDPVKDRIVSDMKKWVGDYLKDNHRKIFNINNYSSRSNEYEKNVDTLKKVGLIYNEQCKLLNIIYANLSPEELNKLKIYLKNKILEYRLRAIINYKKEPALLPSRGSENRVIKHNPSQKYPSKLTLNRNTLNKINYTIHNDEPL